MNRFKTGSMVICVVLCISSLYPWPWSKSKEKSNVSTSFHIKSSSDGYSVLPCMLGCFGEHLLTTNVAKVIRDDLDFTDQFTVALKKVKQEVGDRELKKLFDDGTSLYIELYEGTHTDDRIEVVARVKDTNSGCLVHEEKASVCQKSYIIDAHRIAEKIIYACTGEKGVCLSSLAYCEMRSQQQKVICVSDYACKQRRVVVPGKAVNVAPKWHTQAPILFYSQFTKSNNRLMSLNLKTKKQRVVCSYNGLNMQPAFSGDGSRAVVCLSGGKGNSELYCYDENVCKKLGRRVFKQLTNNGAHNVTPCLLANGDVVFCSDYRSRVPQICYLERETQKMWRLTNDYQYSADPDYCGVINTVVYTKPVGMVFQLFTINLDNMNILRERQLTFNSGNKHDPSWSVCGRYIVFSYEDPYQKGRKTPQIAVLNVKSGKIRGLTAGGGPKSFPRWNGRLA